MMRTSRSCLAWVEIVDVAAIEEFSKGFDMMNSLFFDVVTYNAPKVRVLGTTVRPSILPTWFVFSFASDSLG